MFLGALCPGQAAQLEYRPTMPMWQDQPWSGNKDQPMHTSIFGTTNVSLSLSSKINKNSFLWIPFHSLYIHKAFIQYKISGVKNDFIYAVSLLYEFAGYFLWIHFWEKVSYI